MYGIIGLLLLLVAVLTIEVYRATEGFTVATPTTTPTSTTTTTPTSTTTTPTSTTTTPTSTTTTPTSTTTTTTATNTAPTSATTIATSAIDALALDRQERSKFLRDIQDIVRTEMLSTKQITTANSQPVLSAATTAKPTATGQISEQQGREAVTAREKACPKDMSEYIRKDSIPCWNCTLDY
jgi:hypothetical protein